jgi:5S rRNA maturation endonuclease (ribonuclease M5)
MARNHSDITAETVISYLEEVIEQNPGTPILVEGKNDEECLKELGFRGKFYRINVGLSMPELAEQIGREDNEIILLTDWDDMGEGLFLKMKALLMANGVKVITEVRRDLGALLRRYTKDVESLSKALEAMKNQM